MLYPVVIHKDSGSDYGVTVPDLPGCFSAGDSLEDALRNTFEAIECHIEGLLLDHDPIPAAQPMEAHQSNPDYQGGVWALVAIDLTKIEGKAVRVNISIPERLLDKIDKYAKEAGETRSGLLTRAALEYVERHA